MKFTVKLKITRKLSVWRETGEVRDAKNDEPFVTADRRIALGPTYAPVRIARRTEEDVVVDREVPVPEWIVAEIERMHGVERNQWTTYVSIVPLAQRIALAYYAEHPERVPKEE